jgi:hypothetical protein
MGLVTQAQSDSRIAHLDRLAAVVLLAGTVRATKLSQAIGKSILDLPVDSKQSILSYWHQEIARLAGAANRDGLAVRVLVDRDATEPNVSGLNGQVTLAVERDRLEFRGTGGVLKDISGEYNDDDFLLVANAAQVLMQPLDSLAQAMADRGGDVTIVSHADGTPSGLMLVRCGALRAIASAGFVDMKEQALPAIAISQRVEVLQCDRATGFPVRSRAEYITALRRYYHQREGQIESNDPYAEDWQPAFSLVEDGGKVASGARVHDSVILKGATVENGAVVVRSVVAGASVIRKGAMVVEDLVASETRS